MDIIADTNIFLAVALNEPERDRIIKLTVDASALAPEILPYEIGNALSAMVKRRQLTQSEALEAERSVAQVAVRLVSMDYMAHCSLRWSRIFALMMRISCGARWSCRVRY